MKREERFRQIVEYDGLEVRFNVLEVDRWLADELGIAITKAIHPLIYPAINLLEILTEEELKLPGKKKKDQPGYYGFSKYDFTLRRAKIKLLGDDYKCLIIEILAHEVAHILEDIIGNKLEYHSPHFLHFEAIVLERISFEISACGNPLLEMGESQ